jgi:hypothetical protein
MTYRGGGLSMIAMTRALPILLLFALFAIVSPACAQNSSLPKIVTDGFDIYKSSGVSAAYDFWLNGSPLENDAATKTNVISSIHTIESAYGKYIGYEYIATVPFSASAKRYYVVIQYEKGPLYTWFEVYSVGGKDIIPAFDCNTKANLLLPDSFFEKK